MSKKNIIILVILFFVFITAGYFVYYYRTTDGCLPWQKNYGSPLGCVPRSYRRDEFSPICLSFETTITTPQGEVSVRDLKRGDLILTLGPNGEKEVKSIVKISKTHVPQNFRVVHLVLNDGRSISASAAHPSSDGRIIGNLRTGDILDGSKIVTTESILYKDSYTYDILPAGVSRVYWANGILLKSTL